MTYDFRQADPLARHHHFGQGVCVTCVDKRSEVREDERGRGVTSDREALVRALSDRHSLDVAKALMLLCVGHLPGQ